MATVAKQCDKYISTITAINTLYEKHLGIAKDLARSASIVDIIRITYLLGALGGDSLLSILERTIIMNSKKSSSSMASLASASLRNKNTSKIQKQLAASVLSQVNTSHQTGKAMETVASSVLNSEKYSNATKSFAGSVLAQSDKQR